MEKQLKTFKDHESEVRGYIRSFPTVFDRAIGSELFDTEGTRYIDFFAGAGTLNYGHNPKKAVDAQIAYLQHGGIVHGLDKATVAKKEFIETFVEKILAPRNLEYKLQFTGPTGTNCTEAAMKLARQVKNRSNIVAFTNGYHGHTMGALAVTGNEAYHNVAYDSGSSVSFIPFDGYLGKDFDTLTILRKMISDKSSGLNLPAAVIVETIQGEGGINVASPEWMRELSAICKDFDILLIVDDIQAGNGRSGQFFSFEESGIVPDMVCLSKSIGGGNPMALLLFKEEIDEWNPGEHTGTFRGNSLAFVAAKELINEYWSDESLTEAMKPKSKKMLDVLTGLAEEFPALNATVRGRGFMVGIDTPISGFADKVGEECFNNNLICETCGSEGQVNKLFAALTIDAKILDEGLEIFKAAYRKIAKEL